MIIDSYWQLCFSQNIRKSQSRWLWIILLNDISMVPMALIFIANIFLVYQCNRILRALLNILHQHIFFWKYFIINNLCKNLFLIYLTPIFQFSVSYATKITPRINMQHKHHELNLDRWIYRKIAWHSTPLVCPHV